MHREEFPNASDLIEHLRGSSSSTEEQGNNNSGSLIPNDDKTKYNNRILATYLYSEFEKAPLFFSSLAKSFMSIGDYVCSVVRGKMYAEMSFDSRFEFLKKICRRKIGIDSFEKLHNCLLDGYEDIVRFNSSTGVSDRLRTVVIYTDFDRQQQHKCYVRLRSSPKGRYLSSRFKQKFGIDTTINVEFSFPRMGIHSQLFFLEHEQDENIQKPTDWEVLHQEEMKRYYQFLDSTIETNSTDSYLNHKRRIQRELLSFHEIKKYLEKDISICGCKFSMLCQNMSGMHSYRYTYFSPQLSVIKDTTIESVKNWAVPIGDNKDLYLSEKKLKLSIRLSLFNTPTIKTVQVLGSAFKIIEDIGGCTDGCGYISYNTKYT